MKISLSSKLPETIMFLVGTDGSIVINSSLVNDLEDDYDAALDKYYAHPGDDNEGFVVPRTDKEIDDFLAQTNVIMGIDKEAKKWKRY
jgi:hypothetical protein